MTRSRLDGGGGDGLRVLVSVLGYLQTEGYNLAAAVWLTYERAKDNSTWTRPEAY